MVPYIVDRGSHRRRDAVEEWLFGLDRVSASVRDSIVTAWVSVWGSSSYDELNDMPLTVGVDYPLAQHVNEVTRAGLDLAARAGAEWGMELDDELLVPILILHDIDKPLLCVREGGNIFHSDLARQLPHGVVGAMLLKELGFPHVVISSVATHAVDAPFHGQNPESYVLHYADHFAADHALIATGKKPLYTRMHLTGAVAD